MILRITLIVIAALLMGAHFLRAGQFRAVALCLAAPLLFLWRKRWSLILLQFLAYCAAATWIAVAMQLVQLRQQSGLPWTAAAIILASVALSTLAGRTAAEFARDQERYPS